MERSEGLNTAFLWKLRWIGFAEGVSTLVLFGVAMPLKYLADMPLAVTIAGAIHGALFTILAVTFARAIEAVPIGKRLAAWGIVGALFPFGPFVVDRWLKNLVSPGESATDPQDK